MRTILCLLFICVVAISQAQNVSLDWVKTYGGVSSESAKILRNDSDGNLYIIGNFMGTVDFDPGIGIVNRTSLGGNDVYILKLNNAGNFLWVKTFGGVSNDNFGKAQVDKFDNIIVAGHFVNSIDFDPSANVDIKTSNGQSDVYILKLNSLGNYLWTKTFGAAGHDLARGLSVNSTNDITIAGQFLNTVDFDPGVGVANKSALMVDIYILQLNENGNFNWVKTLEGPQSSSVQVNDLMHDKNNNILMNASYKDSIDVDLGPGIQYLLDTADPLQYNLFILKLDPFGNYIWAKQFDNTVGNTVGISVLSFDSVGNYYLGGLSAGTIDFDFSAAIYTIYTPKSASYILKIDSNANFIWARHMGGFSGVSPEYELVLGIAIDSQSNVSLCGSYEGFEDFDPGPSTFYLGNPSELESNKGYIMQLDNAGNFKWAKNLSNDPAEASANGIVLTNQGKIYVAGDFYGSTDFDFNAGINNITTQGVWDAFLLKIKNCANNITTDTINSCLPITWIDGNLYSVSNYTAQKILINVDGCDSVIKLNLTITTIDTSITQNGNTLIANATNVNYQWVDCSNNFSPIAGQTNQSFTANTNGSYAVVINNGLCSDTSNCYSFTKLSVKTVEDNNIFILPNPSKGFLYVQTDRTVTLKLYNSIGEAILQQKIDITQNNKPIDLNHLAKGLYLYELRDTNNLVSKGKLILE